MNSYKFVPAGQNAAQVGGKLGDTLVRLVAIVTASATSNVSVGDGSRGAVVVVPANTPIGPYPIELGVKSNNGPWKITTGAGVTVLAIFKPAAETT